MKTILVLMLLTSYSALAKDIDCVAAVNAKGKSVSEAFDAKVPGEPDSVSHVIGLMIFEAQTVNDQGIKMMIADAGKGGYGSAIGTLAPGQTLTYVTNDHVINTLTCVYK